MRFWKAGGTALVLGSAAFITPADATIHAQTRQPREVMAPVQRAFEVFSQGAGSRIGVSIDDVSADDVKSKKLSSQSGALIESVDDDSPASKAGLRSGDVVIDFDGERVRSARQLTRLIQETPSGRQVAVAVWRDGQRMNLSVVPESRDSFATMAPGVWVSPTPRAPRAPRPPQVLRSTPRESLRVVPPMPGLEMEIPRLEAFRDGFAYSFGGGRLGVSTQSLGSQLAKHFGVERGVLVTEVTENSAASKAGIRAGDVITKVNDAAIDDTGDLLRELGRRDGEVSIEIVRGGKAQTLKATIEAARPRTVRRVI